MLKGIPSILGPDLLYELARMGHGAELTIGDANFPGHTYGKKVVRMDGVRVPELLDAMLRFFPLDTFVPQPALLMQVVPGDATATPIWDVYKDIVARHDPRGAACFGELERHAFYRRTRERSEVVIMTSETALYANLILCKGVVEEAAS